ncbi:C39 family peptidase [Micromonospora phytophila]|uniref:C39 family peptidase n=1 Tax=Micromonospora phytophila TaxID=709888 RepID=UPI00202F866E|nr:C39 family peptidase [Micromonospora phytophila]MCM0673436.1 C39 family peptidase [Micromonospora phytophila]
MNAILRKRVLSVASCLMIGGAAAVPATPDEAASARPPAVVQAQEPPGEGKKVLDHDYQKQRKPYYCAPAATRIALSTQGKTPSQREVAEKLGTTPDGTKSANDTTRVLNEMTGGGYETTAISGPEAKPEQVDKLQADVVEAVDAKRAVVANTMGTAYDTEGRPHAFPGGHYVSIIGYRDGGDTMQIADPYDPKKHYWMTDKKVATWIAERGYSS